MGVNSIKGTVTSGLSEGSMYIKIYFDKLVEKLGFEPFFGTLNVDVDPDERKDFVKSAKDFFIEAFQIGGNRYGPVHCFKVLINGETEGAALMPEYAKYPNPKVPYPDSRLELIAPINLSDNHNLNKGDKVLISKND